MKCKKLWIPALFALGTLPAQTTHYVNGPDLQNAIRRASAGDVLIVYGRFYSTDFLIVDKPLFIHKDPRSSFAIIDYAHVYIRNIPAGRSLVFQGFSFEFGSRLFVENCAGQVLLADLTHGRNSSMLTAKNCADLTITQSKLGYTLNLDRCTTTMFEVTAVGTPYYNRNSVVIPATSGITVTGGSLNATDVDVYGGYGGSSTAAPGIRLQNAALVVNGASTIRGGCNAAQVCTPAVGGSGTAAYDPSVTFSGSRSFDPNVQATRRDIPFVAIRPSQLGTRAKVRFAARSGALYGLFVGPAGPPIAIPGFEGELAIARPTLLSLGTMPAWGAIEIAFTVPNVPQLRAEIFRWQGATVRQGVGRWSNPLSECHY